MFFPRTRIPVEIKRAYSMMIPEPLKKGDTIGILAPASPFDPIRLEQGVSLISAMGFKTAIPKELYGSNGYLSAPDAIRADHIHRYFSNKNIKAIVCARGGYGSIRILSLLDYDLIGKNPKIFMGFSDITLLLAAFYSKCGLVTFHGPMVATLPSSDPVSRESFFNSLTLSSPLEMSLAEGVVICHGKAMGPLMGGNLTNLCHLMGTPFQPDSRGHILFLEDRGEALYRIDRMLTHLRLAGFLNGIRGLILGAFEGCGDYEAIMGLADEMCGGGEIPIFAGLGSGHGKRNLTLPMGLPAVLDTENGSLMFQHGLNRK
ncbi:MAG: LD-carboxypeptidase [Proteobacteria bacterium]|nr:LD-carboxypeptidase [Pseudomonadota bacterium]